jgi:hypothetical protein
VGNTVNSVVLAALADTIAVSNPAYGMDVCVRFYHRQSK